MGRKKNIGQRYSILKAAYHLFSAEGYENVTTKRIAEQCGLSHSLLHYYFNKKEDIILELFLYIIEDIAGYFRSKGIPGDNHALQYGLLNRMYVHVLLADGGASNHMLKAMQDANTLSRGNAQVIDRQQLDKSPGSNHRVISYYIHSGCLSQLLILALGEKPMMTIEQALKTSFHVYCQYLSIGQEEYTNMLGIIEATLTDEFISGFYIYDRENFGIFS